MLDIDTKSKYHCKHQLDRLLRTLSDAGLDRSSLYRSSYSDGWHLYLFFDEPINTADLRRQLVKLLTLNDFQVAKGTLEVFPHRSDASLGMGLRLPLQPGFAWLNKHDLEVDYERAQLSPAKALELFVDALEGDANSYASFRQLRARVQELEGRMEKAAAHGRDPAHNVVPLRRTADISQSGEFVDAVAAIFGRLPPGIIADNWYKGRNFHLNGLSGPSQRAEAILCVGHYFFYGDPGRDLPALGYSYEQERQWALQEFLAARHNGYSDEINRRRPDALAQANRAAHWRPAHRKENEPQKYSPTRPVSWIRENANRKQDARTRIQKALDGIKRHPRAFTTVELQEKAGCSRRTLYDHADIWRKDYEDLAAGFFAFCTDEYNGVGGAGCSETKPLPTTLEPNMPPERLAAQRLVYELSMRVAREQKRAENQALLERQAAEKAWRQKVDSLCPEDTASLTPEQLKTLLVVLITYLATAPCEEDQFWLEGLISGLRQRLSDYRQLGPRLAVPRSPPGTG